MRYQGGKSRIAKEIAEIINAEVKDRAFVSLFCGGCAVEERIKGAASVVCNDTHPYLIAMWKSLQSGWLPPSEVGEEEYARVKQDKDSDPALAGFVGFGCSFGGKWFGGYARYQEHNYADTSRRSVLRSAGELRNAAFLNSDYRSVKIPDNAVVYLDPPYANTLGYSTGTFDSGAFWQYVYEISARATVFVSEETAPDWASCVWSKEFTRTLDVNKANQPTKVEKLFRIDRRDQKGMKISCDVETFSDVDLKTHGMYKYVESPNFELLLLAYSVDGSPVEVIDLAQGEVVPTWLQDALFDPANILSGYNVIFERAVLSKYFGREIPLTMCRDTMLSALYCGYPASLDAAGEAIGLPQDKRKLTTGKALIRLFCTPTKPTRTNGERTRTYPRNEPEKWNLFKEYNAQDVVTEMAIANALSAFPVPDEVQEQWVLDQIINQRGVGVDTRLVEGALKIGAETHDKLLAEAAEISGLDNPKSVQQLTKWLEKEIPDEMEGVNDLRKETVTDLLAAGVKSTDAGRMLEIRQLLGKTSTKKYDSITKTVCADERVHGLFQFYGANRSGRDAGRLVQVQNLPRNSLKSLNAARELALRGDAEAMELLFGNVPDTLSQLIRTAFIPSAGHQFIVTDFSAIEARVLAWMAGEQWVLDVFATTGKIYEATASQMFGVPVERIVHGNPEYELRQRGKVAVLGLGYGMGAAKLIDTAAKQYKVIFTPTEADEIVRLWRAKNQNIVRFWYDIERAALHAVKMGQPSTVQCITYRHENDGTHDYLTAELPSGRKLFYAAPFITTNRFGNDSIGFWGQNQTTKKWEQQETYSGRLVENLTQAVARDCLMISIQRLEAAGFPVVMHIHDEVVLDCPMDKTLDEANAIMGQPIPWAPGLLLKGAGFVGNYYKKD